jgi:hypothetical protein
MRTVTTVNSVYEINEADHLIRRVSGVNDPTPRQGPDNVWCSYARLGLLGDGLLITWATEEDAEEDHKYSLKLVATARCTLTSKIMSDVVTPWE